MELLHSARAFRLASRKYAAACLCVWVCFFFVVLCVICLGLSGSPSLSAKEGGIYSVLRTLKVRNF